ncbi:metallophosphoesterase [bacterium]|nr:metallophosphoesterase [bacterium]
MGSVTLVGAEVQAIAEYPVEFNILLARPTDDSITANIIPDYDVDFYIEYGTVSGVYSSNTITYSAIADEVIELVIDELSANTRYFYRLNYSRDGVSEWNVGEEYSFRTQRSSGSSFTFTIVSDSHLGQFGGQTADELALYEQTLQNVQDDQPDFHIDVGDTFAMDPSPLGTGMTPEEAMAAYYVQRPYLGEITHSIPYFQVIGNHENEEGWNFDDEFTPPDQSLAIVGMAARKYYIPIPIPDDFYTGNEDPLPEPIGGDTYHEDYFAWKWGDALFVVLDPYHYSLTWPSEGGDGYGGEGQDGEPAGDRWDWTLGIEQYLWFKDVLETSTSKYKFVFSHHVTGGKTQYGRGGISAAPYFEWGGYNADDTWGWDEHRPASEGWDVPVHQLMVENGVNIYFHGHDHMYAAEELDGILYIEVPKPDDAGYTWEPYSYGYNEGLYLDADAVIQNSGHIRVTVTPTNVTTEYVRSYLPGDGTNGVIADTRVSGPEMPDILGDLNHDGFANSTDALIALKGDVGLDISSHCPVNCGDTNDDGYVNSTDALLILKYDVGLTISFPIGEEGCSATITQPPGCTP